MKDNLVERLRAECIRNNGAMGRIVPVNPDGQEAAARIEKLEAALEKIAEAEFDSPPWDAVEHEVKHIARTALTSTREGLIGGEEG